MPQEHPEALTNTSRPWTSSSAPPNDGGSVSEELRLFGYQPALDGVRAVAVVLVLLFHAGLPLFSGGYIGVSVFFTLSGYLITSLLLTEHARTGRVSVAEFYSRRIRRLLPASTLCVVLVVTARAFGAFSQVDALRRDVVGALLYSFNWVKLAAGTSYGDLFLGGTSPLEHYWSLAIEEQFYWLWPAVLVVILRIVGRRRAAVIVTCLFLAVSAIAIGIARIYGANAAYWSTPARLPEILVGAALACVLARGWQVRPQARWLAFGAFGAIVGLAVWLPAGSGPAYSGALPVFSVFSACLIYALQVPGLMRRILSWRPLVGIGKISYGLYLFHWPVFVLLREHLWNLTRPLQLFVALSITLAITLASYWLIELPVRRSRAKPRVTLRWAVLATGAALGGAVLIGPSTSSFAAHRALADKVAITPSASVKPLTSASIVPADDSGATTMQLGPPPERPVRILLIGDSTMNSVTVGLEQWASTRPDYVQITGVWAPSMVFLRTGEITDPRLRGLATAAGPFLDDALVNKVPALHPDVVVLMTTLCDVTDRRWPEDEAVIGPSDPRYRARLKEADANLTKVLLDAGVPHVVWMMPPVPLAVPLDPNPVDPVRYRVEQDLIREVVATHTGDGTSIFELEKWLTATGHLGRDFRKDGLHILDDKSAVLAEQYLGPWLVRQAVGA